MLKYSDLLSRTTEPSEEVNAFHLQVELSLNVAIYDFVKDTKLKAMLQDVVNNQEFQTQVGSKGHHHAYKGGLMVHTAEVLEQCLASSKLVQANVEVLTGAAIYHDFNKIFEYTVTDGKITTTPYRTLVRHVAGSYATFMEQAGHHGLGDDLKLQIGHCILSHHGDPSSGWGSAVQPQTKEAWILHFADMMSARFGPRMNG